MHELSIVEALVGQVREEVRRSGCSGRVKRLDLVVGRLSGVHCDSLRFAFDLLVPHTSLEAAELKIRQIGAECHCDACGAHTEIDRLVLQCPSCFATDVRIEGGDDLVLETIELEDCQTNPSKNNEPEDC